MCAYIRMPLMPINHFLPPEIAGLLAFQYSDTGRKLPLHGGNSVSARKPIVAQPGEDNTLALINQVWMRKIELTTPDVPKASSKYAVC